MTKLAWDLPGERSYENGVDQGVLYLPDAMGNYTAGVAWNGLIMVTEKPTGAAPNAKFADNLKYLNLYSLEEFGVEIDAYTYPDEFAQFDGLWVPTPGIAVAQQARKHFGLSYRTRIGDDQNDDAGYKLHLVYGCTASPSDKAYGTINESPDGIQFKWVVSTIPVAVTGRKPTSLVTIDSTKVDPATLADLEQQLYGDVAVDPFLPLPDAIVAMFEGAVTTVRPVQPAYNEPTHTITIPATAGVVYYIGGIPQAAGDVVIAGDTVVTAEPAPGNVFAEGVDNDWYFAF